MSFFWRHFSAIAAKYAPLPAIEETGRVMSYAMLAARAAGIGEALKRQNIAPETPVALEFEKSADYIAAMLGCWYAGLPFLPLPPSLPQERRDHIMRHAHIRHVLNVHELAKMPAHTGDTRPADVADGTLAYIIYTSGSSGAPKGVMVEHRGIMNFLTAQIDAFGLGAGKRVLFYLSILFDAAISDIGTALLSGATLVIPTPDVLRDGAALVKTLHAEKITHLDLPPSLLKALTPEDMPSSLETLIIGGEVCPPPTVRRWAEKFRVINVYGPTETTVCSSLCLCDAKTWTQPLIGDPLPGVEYAVYDESGLPATEGELYIGGNCLARGYLNDAALTQEKFVLLSGRRFYKTGDHARRLQSNDIAFLGRLDRQFKLHGQLIEPGEVEAQLLAQPAVRRAAVMKRDERLVAFLQADPEARVSGIAASLKKSLPSWMIPQDFIFPGSWPTTPTGKTDLAALKTLRTTQAADKHALPRTETERKLWDIWRNVLGHGDFGVTDDFFSVGGDSLAIIRMTLEAGRRGLTLRTETLASCRTIEKLAQEATRTIQGISCDSLKQDVAFDSGWKDLFVKAKQRPAAAERMPAYIFLTGGAGFLGGRLLGELLEKTTAKITCLVRAEDAAAAQRRIEKSLSRFAKNIPAASLARVNVLCGDLALPYFGLSPEKWHALSETSDAVYHCAAQVNMVLNYQELRPANIVATQEVLRFCCAGKRKTLHYASTLSVFVAADQNKGRLVETDRLEKTQVVYGGYAQTKWAAEWMLLQTPKDICDIRHYRFGLITGDQTTGLAAEADFLAMFARGLSTLRLAPEGFDDRLFVDITPIDYAAAAMVYLSLHGRADIYHVANRQSLSLGHLLAAIERKCGPMRRLPPERWREAVENTAATPEETATRLALCRCLPDMFAQYREMDLFQATDVIFDTAHTDADLKGGGLSCPQASGDLLDLYMDSIFKTARQVTKICIFGPESTGKSKLAEKLAAHFKTGFVPEYAKELIFAQSGQITIDDIPRIARGQIQTEKEMSACGPNVLFCDTDLITTTIWSDWLFGSCPAWIRDAADAQRYALYLLLDIDTPWVDDMHRFLPEERASFLQKCQTELEKRGIKYVLISGGWQERLEKAVAAINATLNKN